jgi:hypothetical protein
MAQWVDYKGLRMHWRGDDLRKAVTTEVVRRVNGIVLSLTHAVKDNIKLARVSKPGEFPGAQTLALYTSVFGVVSAAETRGIVGTDLYYAKSLEFGTSGGQVVYPKAGSLISWVDPATGQRRYAKWITLGPMAPRPFLRRTMYEHLPEIRRLWTAPWGTP